MIVPRVFASRTLKDGNQPISVCTEGLRRPEHKANFVIVLGSNDTSIPSHVVAQLVKALRYKSEGHGFDSRCCHWNFSLT